MTDEQNPAPAGRRHPDSRKQERTRMAEIEREDILEMITNRRVDLDPNATDGPFPDQTDYYTPGVAVTVHRVIDAVVCAVSADGTAYVTWGDNNRQAFTPAQQNDPTLIRRTDTGADR